MYKIYDKIIPALSKIRVWIRAMRAFSFTATVIPVSLGAVLALIYENRVAWNYFPIVLLGALSANAAVDVINDYEDFFKGVDRKGSLGSSGVLIDGLMSPRELLFEAWVFYIIAAALGFFLILERGAPMAVIIAAAFAGSYFYTSRPIGYKYHALGEVLIFFLMGPLIVIGSFFALTGVWRADVFFISLPVGSLVTAILNGNNYRDIEHDAEAGIKTIAIVLGRRKAKWMYALLLLSAYAFVSVEILAKILPVQSLTVLLTLPLALRLILRIEKDKKERLARIDVDTAVLHLLFGTLLVLSIFFMKNT